MVLRRRRFAIPTLVAIMIVVVAGGALAFGPATDDDDQPITGPALAMCTEAALAAHPGGTVTETEIGDDGAAYEVEVKFADGSQIEVNLDENCTVTGSEPDDNGPNGEDDND